MNAYKALAIGFQRMLTVPGVVFWLYALNLMFALPYAFGLRATLQATLGSSLAPAAMMGDCNITVVGDYLHHHGEAFVAAARPLAAIGAVYILASIFFTGGVLVAVREMRHGISSTEFFAGCGRYFGKFFRLFLIVGGSAFLVVLILSIGIEALLGVWISHADSEIPGTIAIGIRFLYLSLVVLAASLVMDYARIDAVVNGLPSMRRSAWKGLRFVYRRLGRSMKLQMLLLLCFVFAACLYLLLEQWVGTTAALNVAVVVGMQQLYVFSRSALRVFGFASESLLYQELSPPGGGIPGWDFGHGWE